jgi:hypothetical protein
MPSKRAKKTYSKPIPNASSNGELVHQSLLSPPSLPLLLLLDLPPSLDPFNKPTIDEPIIDELTIYKPILQEKNA